MINTATAPSRIKILPVSYTHLDVYKRQFIQSPIRVAGTYALLGVLGIQAVSVGVGIGWAVMSVYELWSYRGWKRRTAGQSEG